MITPAEFEGRWRLESTEGFDDYMERVGAKRKFRKYAPKLDQVLTIKVDGDQWTMKWRTAVKSYMIEFVPGAEARTVKTADGRVLRTVFFFEKGKLLQKEMRIKQDDRDSHIERYIDPTSGKLITTLESGDVLCKMVYAKLH